MSERVKIVYRDDYPRVRVILSGGLLWWVVEETV